MWIKTLLRARGFDNNPTFRTVQIPVPDRELASPRDVGYRTHNPSYASNITILYSIIDVVEKNKLSMGPIWPGKPAQQNVRRA